MAIPFTLAQYEATVKAFAAGVTSVTVEGRRTDFISRDDMLKNIQLMRSELEAQGLIVAAATPPIRALRIITHKGL